jgi:hypothetical protein
VETLPSSCPETHSRQRAVRSAPPAAPHSSVSSVRRHPPAASRAAARGPPTASACPGWTQGLNPSSHAQPAAAAASNDGSSASAAARCSAVGAPARPPSTASAAPSGASSAESVRSRARRLPQSSCASAPRGSDCGPAAACGLPGHLSAPCVWAHRARSLEKD